MGSRNRSVGGYSEATTARIEGLDPRKELASWAKKLNLSSESQLHILLSEKLHKMDPSSEHAEYLHWLLSTIKATKNSNKEIRRSNNRVDTVRKISNKDAADKQQTFETNVMFADCSNLHPLSKRALIEGMGLTSMTEIQAKTFDAASTGQDVLGRARTGMCFFSCTVRVASVPFFALSFSLTDPFELLLLMPFVRLLRNGKDDCILVASSGTRSANEQQQ
jgi:hypothetical protein